MIARRHSSRRPETRLHHGNGKLTSICDMFGLSIPARLAIPPCWPTRTSVTFEPVTPQSLASIGRPRANTYLVSMGKHFGTNDETPVRIVVTHGTSLLDSVALPI